MTHIPCVCFLCAIRYTIANIIIEFNIYGSPIPLSAFQFSFPNKLFNVHLILSLYLYLCVQLAFTFRIYSPALFYWQWCTRFCFEVEVTMFALMVTRCILFVFIDLWPWLPDFDLSCSLCRQCIAIRIIWIKFYSMKKLFHLILLLSCCFISSSSI